MAPMAPAPDFYGASPRIVHVDLRKLYAPLWKVRQTAQEIDKGDVSRSNAHPLHLKALGGGRYYVIDGNHRVLEALLAGRKTLPARVGYPGPLPGGVSDLARHADAVVEVASARASKAGRSTGSHTPKHIAALYVEKKGVYSRHPGVDPWDEERDARQYAGPHPAVAHPPCQRWGRYWQGGPSATTKLVKGDDGGCFKAALASVRRFGGVIEHPAGSYAWEHFGLRKPPVAGGWVEAGDGIGYTASVEQGHYGHRARKGTWLYVAGVPRNQLPELMWGPSEAELEHRPTTCEEGRLKERRRGAIERMCKRERLATPTAFSDLLIDLARRVQ